jgi:hypothetical protein
VVVNAPSRLTSKLEEKRQGNYMKRMAQVFEGVSQEKYETMLKEKMGKEDWMRANRTAE